MDSNQFAFKGTPELPNLLRIILQGGWSSVEYDQFKVQLKVKFIENELNKDFVNISWDQSNNWGKDRKGFPERYTVDPLVEGYTLFHWFKHESSSFSFQAAVWGMNEDFAEAFVYYFQNGYYNYKISLVLDGDLVLIDDLQTSTPCGTRNRLLLPES